LNEEFQVSEVENMNAVYIGLLTIAILLLIYSFFKKDPVHRLEKELEELTLTHMQDMYNVKRKIKILEEELFIQDSAEAVAKQPHVNEILKAQVLSLFQQGLSLDQISKQSTLPMETVRKIIEDNGSRGVRYE
jgi:hypothetical protein